MSQVRLTGVAAPRGAAAWRARLVRGPQGWIDDGVVVVHRGRIAWVGRRARAPLSGAVLRDLGEGALVRGFVDAHAHLDLTHAHVEEHGDFGAWVRAVVAARRAASSAQLEQAWRAGEASLLAGGCTTTADIDGGHLPRVPRTTRLRVVSFVELLDGRDPLRTPGQVARVQAVARRRALHAGGRTRFALSPHAPHTVSRSLLSAAVHLRAPLQLHCAETQAELDWLEHGTGPLAPLLPSSPRRGALELLSAGGVLRRGTTLVHCNLLDPARDGELLARRGVALVHCPGTHAWFRRAPFPLRAWLAQGVQVVLGTDSLASNARLDCRHEAALALDTLGLSPSEALDMIGDAAERALGLPFGKTGLVQGARADFALHGTTLDGEGALEELLRAQQPVVKSWIAGRETLPRAADADAY